MTLFSRRALPFFALLAGACGQAEKREFLDPDLPRNPSILARIVVGPAPAGLVTEEMTRFIAYGRTSTGDSIPVQVTWRATGGTINQDGFFLAEDPGNFVVAASVADRPEMADSVPVVVNRRPPRLVAVLVEPGPASMPEGDAQAFTAIGYYDDGTVRTEPANWTTSGGLIDTAGVYQATGPAGEYDIVANLRNQSLASLTRVRVTNREASTAFDITPSPVTLAPSQSTTFSGVITWDDGSQSSPAISWTATGGSISTTGVYRAGSVPGSYRVIGKVVGGKRADTVAVTVQASPFVSVTVTPAAATLAVGGAVHFQATGLDAAGSVRLAPVMWTATGGTINSNGTYTAGTVPGTYRIIGQLAGGGPADTSVATIAAGTATLVSLSTTPATVSLPSGANRQFAVSAQWSDGSTAIPPVTWSATGGTVTAGGLYTAGAATGAFRIIAAHAAGKADTSAITITAPSTTAIALTPGSAVVTVGATQQFAATATLSNGTQSTSGMVWSATGGSISSSGLYTAGSLIGSYFVIASQNGVADTAPVSVQPVAPPTLTSIAVSPSNASVLASGTQQFAVTGTWSDGTNGAPPVAWSATGGTISSGGLFKAGTTSGTYRVIAKYTGGSQADTAVVTVAAPTLVALSLTPAVATVVPSGSQQFSVSGSLSNGAPATPSVSYSATGGTISAAGLYTAGTVTGTYRVIAKEIGGSLADTSKVTISTTAPTLVSVALNPASASVSTGATKQFSAIGTLSDGSTTTPTLTWTATGGTISTGGLYTAGSTTGTYRAIVTVQGSALADTAAITVSTVAAPTLVAVSMTPDILSVATGGSAQMSATGKMSDGSTVAITPAYAATGGTITTAGRYTAGATTGNYRVIASYQSLADTTTITVTPPANYVALYSDAYSKYATDADLKTAYTNNTTHELWGFSPVPWSKTGVIPDNVFGKALKTVHEAQVPYYDLVAYPDGKPGSTTRMKIYLAQGSMTHMWVRFYVRFAAPASNPIGWKTKSPSDPSPYGGAYKVFFLHWANPYSERGALTFSNTQRLDVQAYVSGNTTLSEVALPGSGRSQGLTNSDAAEFSNGEWYEMIYLYQKTGTYTARAGAWVRRYTNGQAVNPGPYKWWASDQTFAAAAPVASWLELGANKNHGNQYEQWVIWGPWEVVDGTKFYNPWGVPGI